MRIARWHFGKLLILWSWGLVVMALLWYVVLDLEPDPQNVAGSVAGLGALAFLVLVPFGLTVVTWIWLTGKEAPVEDSEPEGSQDTPSE